MVKVDNGVGMSVEVGDADDRGDAVVDGEKDVGVGGEELDRENCFRFPKICRKLWEDLP